MTIAVTFGSVLVGRVAQSLEQDLGLIPADYAIMVKTAPGFAEVLNADDGVIATELESFYKNVSPRGISQGISQEKSMQLARYTVIVRIRPCAEQQVFL